MQSDDYTIPRNNRELQQQPQTLHRIRIIPYQEIIGNYSLQVRDMINHPIIPYQEIIGNYSIPSVSLFQNTIIPYQEIIGNYSGYTILESV